MTITRVDFLPKVDILPSGDIRMFSRVGWWWIWRDQNRGRQYRWWCNNDWYAFL